MVVGSQRMVWSFLSNGSVIVSGCSAAILCSSGRTSFAMRADYGDDELTPIDILVYTLYALSSGQSVQGIVEMAEASQSFRPRKRMSLVADALARAIRDQPKTVVSNYDLFQQLWSIYKAGSVKYLRTELPSRVDLRRVRSQLRSAGIIRQDKDYKSHWRIVDKADLSADEIVCSVDPFCHVAHLSALQRYGLSNRRPERLILVEPTPQMRRRMLHKQMEQEYGSFLTSAEYDIEPAKAVKHPIIVRDRPVMISTTKYPHEQVPIRGTLSRIATIGQAFLDTLESPEMNGGMSHVLEVWSEHAAIYLEEIIERVGRCERSICKVRAGYILEERIGVRDRRVSTWSGCAQRGSSRVLDPSRPFAPIFSEKWMLSINV